MEEILDHLGEWTSYPPIDWLICDQSHQLPQQVEQFYLELTQLSKNGTPPKIILAEPQPVKFLAGFMAACAAHCPVFLCNPNWVQQEWQQVFELVQPDVVWGVGSREWGVGDGEATTPSPSSPPLPSSPPHSPLSTRHSPLIMIPTGGSSGRIKFAIHTWETLKASVGGFAEFFQINQVNSFCVLPLYHVSGLMQFMRSFLTGGKLVIQPFKEVESDQIYNIHPSEFFISLVPTQLQRLLQNPQLTEWLSHFETVLLGGAPAWHELLEKARYYQIRLAPTYGMTETASQIATLKPDDFLNGRVCVGQILPHAKVTICNQQGEALNINQIGNIKIQSESLALGYYTFPPNYLKQFNYLQVDDLGFFDEQGNLKIVGRSSDKIITGGENVYPLEIESAIRSTEMVVDVCVIGIPDKSWGQAVTAIYIPKNPQTPTTEIHSLLKNKLNKFKIPKHWIPVSTLPRNSQGKINRQQMQQIAMEWLAGDGE
jgi:O-succinylbenzoic acid--CoA ligase